MDLRPSAGRPTLLAALIFCMKCTTCNKLKPYECHGFKTHHDFIKAGQQIEAMKAAGELESLIIYDFQCSECAGRWELSLPDNAYRGFLKLVSARAQKIEKLLNKQKT